MPGSFLPFLSPPVSMAVVRIPVTFYPPLTSPLLPTGLEMRIPRGARSSRSLPVCLSGGVPLYTHVHHWLRGVHTPQPAPTFHRPGTRTRASATRQLHEDAQVYLPSFLSVERPVGTCRARSVPVGAVSAQAWEGGLMEAGATPRNCWGELQTAEV